MDFSLLSDDQKNIAKMIADECEAVDVDPALGLAIGWAENRFTNTTNKKSGAVGPMQVMPGNAKGHGMTVKDLKKLENNIKVGCQILKNNLDKYDGDALYAVAAYNTKTSTANKFAETQDMSSLPEATQKYIKEVDANRPLDEPGLLSLMTQAKTETTPEGAVPDEAESMFGKVEPLPEMTQQEVAAAQPSDFMSYVRKKAQELQSLPMEEQLGALAGAGVGAVAGRQEIKAAKQATEAAKAAPAGGSAGQKWSAKTGFGRGEGETVREVSESFQKAKNKGKVSGKIPVGGTLNVDEMLRRQKLAEELAARERLASMGSKASKVLGKIPGGSVLAGAGAGIEGAEAVSAYNRGDIAEAALHGLAAAGDVGTLVPHPAIRFGGGALSLATMPILDILQQYRGISEAKKKGRGLPVQLPQEIEYDILGNPIR